MIYTSDIFGKTLMLNNIIDSKDKEIKELKKELDSLYDKYNDVCDEYNDIVDENKRLNDKIDIKDIYIQKSGFELQYKINENERLTAELITKSHKVKELENELEIIKNNYGCLEKQQISTQRELDKLRKDYKNLQKRHDRLLHYPG